MRTISLGAIRLGFWGPTIEETGVFVGIDGERNQSLNARIMTEIAGVSASVSASGDGARKKKVASLTGGARGTVREEEKKEERGTRGRWAAGGLLGVARVRKKRWARPRYEERGWFSIFLKKTFFSFFQNTKQT